VDIGIQLEYFTLTIPPTSEPESAAKQESLGQKWWVECHDDEWRIVQAGCILDFPPVIHTEEDLQLVADAHNAALAAERQKREEAERCLFQMQEAAKELTAKLDIERARTESCSAKATQDYEPEQKYGSAHDLREHLRHGGTREDY
jgi:hypothetical protein